nr:hypothetical protein [Herbaspirillum sp. ASV7]
MPVKGQRYGKANDTRFTMHHMQPRAGKLSLRQLAVCRQDQAFAASLRKRVSNPSRWDAFIKGENRYKGKPCKRCGSNRRRVRDCACYDCMLATNRNDWALLRRGFSPPAQQTRDGFLDKLERNRRERAGEVAQFISGLWTAQQFPTGRLAVSCPAAVIRGHGLYGEELPALPPSRYLAVAPFGTMPHALGYVCSDLQQERGEVVLGLASRNPDLVAVLRWASWM